MLVIQSQNLDSAQSVHFARELEIVRAKAYDVKYPELKGISLVTLEQDPAGAETITYKQYDRAGVAKLIANYADDIPVGDVFAKEFSARVFGFSNGYVYSIQDIRASQLAGSQLDLKRATNARRVSDENHDRTIYFGNETAGMTGLFNNPNITTGDVVAGASTTTAWTTKTPDEILKDLNNAFANVVTLTNGTEAPNTLLLPIAQLMYIQSTARSANSDLSILEYFQRNRPEITRVDWINQLADVGSRADMPDTTGNAFMMYNADADVLGYRAPVWFEQFAPQEVNLAFKVACHSRSAGVAFYRPLAAIIKGGI